MKMAYLKQLKYEEKVTEEVVKEPSTLDSSVLIRGLPVDFWIISVWWKDESTGCVISTILI